jgi:hypothetical protein
MRGNCQRSADAKSGPCIKSASTRIDANWQHEVVLGRMSKAKRIQRSRAKGWKMPANAIYVGRPTVWGNPYVVGSQLLNGETLTAEKAIALYEQHVADNFNERDIRHCLHDKDLACWCALDQPCHADVLLRIANSRPK